MYIYDKQGVSPFRIAVLCFGLILVRGNQLTLAKEVRAIKELNWDGEVAVDADQVTFTFTVKNTSELPIILEFPTSQFYDYTVYNNKEERVHSFSKGKVFFQALQFKTLNSGELIQLKSMWNYNTNEAEKVPAGIYTVKAILTIRKINDRLVHSMPSTLLKFYLPPLNAPSE